MNGSTIQLPVVASEIGLYDKGVKPPKGVHPAHDFTYAVNAFDKVHGTVDTTGAARFSPFNPAFSSGDFASLDPGDSTTLPLTVDKSQLKHVGGLGWLVASLDDANGAPQAAEIAGPSEKDLH